MNDVVLGIFSLVVGLVICFRGYLTMRVVIPIWGAFTGFAIGAGFVAGVTNVNVLSSVLGWAVGLGVGLLFGLLAYLYFEVSIVLGMTAIGFMLGASLMVGLNVTWTWLIVLGGAAVGLLLAVFAIAGDLPMMLLTVLTAFAGSSAAIGGLMILAGEINTRDLDEASVVSRIQDAPGWWVAYFALALVGIGVQFQASGSLRQTVRQEWEAERRGTPQTA